MYDLISQLQCNTPQLTVKYSRYRNSNLSKLQRRYNIFDSELLIRVRVRLDFSSVDFTYLIKLVCPREQTFQ